MEFGLIEIESNKGCISDCFPEFFDDCNPTTDEDCMPNGYSDTED